VERLYSAAQIRKATIGLASQLNSDYKGHQIQFLGVLKGSFLFLADLVRHITVPCTVDFVRLSSYGAATASSGAVNKVMPWSDPVRDRHLVVVEEIVDSGNTLARLLADLQAEGPASLRVCTLIDKRGRRETPVPVDYHGFVLEDGFVVGYGLDYDERFRNLPDIHVLSENEITT
jgi:hypoxanthine phosphoribosyltransferase